MAYQQFFPSRGTQRDQKTNRSLGQGTAKAGDICIEVTSLCLSFGGKRGVGNGLYWQVNINPRWHPGSRRKAAPNILQAWRLWWCVSESAEARLHVPDRTLESLYTVGNTPSTQSCPKSSSAVVAIFVSLWCGNSGSFAVSSAFRGKGAKRERTVWIESLWRWVGCAAATRLLRSSWPQQRWRFRRVLSPTRGWTQER